MALMKVIRREFYNRRICLPALFAVNPVFADMARPVLKVRK
jgi:hypothetical protein